MPEPPAPNLVSAAVVRATVGLAGFVRVVHQKLRYRSFARENRWRARVDRQLPGWLKNGGCPARWLRSREKRRFLLEALLAVAQQDEQGLGPACRQAISDWGLLELQVREVRRSDGWERAQAVCLLGRTRHPRAVPLLGELLQDQSQDVCGAAVRALGLQATPDAARPLLSSLTRLCSRVPEAFLREALVSCCRPNPAVLLPHLESRSGPDQRILLGVVAEVATSALLPALENLVPNEDAQVRAQAARALGRVADPAAVPLLIKLADDPDGTVRNHAVKGLDLSNGWSLADVFISVIYSKHSDVRTIGARRLAENLREQTMTPQELMPAVGERLGPQGWATLLGALEPGGAGSPLTELLNQPAPALQEVAGRWASIAVPSGAARVLLEALLGTESVAGEEDTSLAVADFVGQYGDVALLAELEGLAARLPAGSQEQQRTAQVRGRIRERWYSDPAVAGDFSR